MTPSTPIPSDVRQRAVNAANNASRAASSLCGSATFQGLVSAELAIKRAEAELRSLRPALRQLKAEARRLERQVEQDRAIIARQREVMA